jgi:hypothetical protein
VAIDWRVLQRPSIGALFLFCLIGALRAPSFFLAESDWDVSLYVLMADQWLKGHPPYTAVFDNKPPGIYALFALALGIWRSMLSVRLLSLTVTFATCLLIQRIVGTSERGGPIAGFAAAVLYAFFSAVNGGESGQAEIFVACLSVWSLLNVMAAGDRLCASGSTWRLAVAGLSLGAAIMIKPTALFDLVAITLVYAHAVVGVARAEVELERRLIQRTAVHVLVMVACVAVAPALTVGAFYWSGHIDEFWRATYTANHARTIAQPFNPSALAAMLASNVRNEPMPWLITALAAALAARERTAMSARQRAAVVAALAWFATVLVCMLFVMRTALYDHYFLQLAAPAAMAGGWLVTRLWSGRDAGARARRGVVVALGAALLVLTAWPAARDLAKLVVHRVVLDEKNWGDRVARAASVIKGHASPSALIYVVDTSPIFYFLTDAELPTRYVFPPLLIARADMPDIAGIDRIGEVDRVFAQQPELVIRWSEQSSRFYAPDAFRVLGRVQTHLGEHYQHVETVEGFEIYGRKPR